jgi:hypothetical protein
MTKYISAGFEVLTATFLKAGVLLDVPQCCWESGSWCFVRLWCLYVHRLKISHQTSWTTCRMTKRYIPQDFKNISDYALIIMQFTCDALHMCTKLHCGTAFILLSCEQGVLQSHFPISGLEVMGTFHSLQKIPSNTYSDFFCGFMKRTVNDLTICTELHQQWHLNCRSRCEISSNSILTFFRAVNVEHIGS